MSEDLGTQHILSVNEQISYLVKCVVSTYCTFALCSLGQTPQYNELSVIKFLLLILKCQTLFGGFSIACKEPRVIECTCIYWQNTPLPSDHLKVMELHLQYCSQPLTVFTWVLTWETSSVSEAGVWLLSYLACYTQTRFWRAIIALIGAALPALQWHRVETANGTLCWAPLRAHNSLSKLADNSLRSRAPWRRDSLWMKVN